MKKYSLLPEHESQMSAWAQRWIDNAMDTRAMTDEDKGRVVEAVRGLYAAADLDAPKAIVFVSSPQTGAIASCIAAMAIWLRDNPDRHSELFGRVLSGAEILQAIPAACARAVFAGMGVSVPKIEPALPAATWDATWDATRDATWDATRDATRAATRAATEADPVIAAMVSAARHWHQMHNGGCHWSGWASWLSFFRRVVGLEIDYSRWVHYETLAEVAASRFMHRDFCIVSERPSVLKTDRDNQPHCEDGPSHAWRDGWKRYHWHGTSVPAEWIEQPESVDTSLALTWENMEQRRALCEILGWENVIGPLSPRVIDTDCDPQIGQLVEVQLPDASQPVRFVRVQCGTGRPFAILVPLETKTAIEAQMRMYQPLTADQIRGRQIRM